MVILSSPSGVNLDRVKNVVVPIKCNFTSELISFSTAIKTQLHYSFYSVYSVRFIVNKKKQKNF